MWGNWVPVISTVSYLIKLRNQAEQTSNKNPNSTQEFSQNVRELISVCNGIRVIVLLRDRHDFHSNPIERPITDMANIDIMRERIRFFLFDCIYRVFQRAKKTDWKAAL